MTKKKMLKRIISCFLTATMLFTMVATLSSCGFFNKVKDIVSEDILHIYTKVVGTEGAKILLARERLDEELVGQKLNVFSTSQTNQSTTENENDDNTINSFFDILFKRSALTSSSLDTPTLVGDSFAYGVTTDSDTVTWRTFKDASELKVSYVQFIEPIDRAAADTAELISTIKKNVGVTEKWVDMEQSKYMLIVEESSETIIEYYKPYEDIHISTRYTTDDAKCVYEMYSFTKYDDGTTGRIRNKCIPGEYYEYMYINSGGFNDYFIADNSRGYWITNRFYFDERAAFFDMAAVKGDMGYGVAVSSEVNEDGSLTALGSTLRASMFSPNEDRDLLTIDALGNNYNIGVYMTNIQSGIASISAPQDMCRYEAEYGHVNDIYLTRDEYGSYNGAQINLTNGGRITAGQCTDKINYTGASIDYNLFFGEETYTGKLNFEIKASSEKEAYRLLTDFLSSHGVTLKTSANEVNESYAHCELLFENFDVMSWYGYQMSSLQNLQNAESMLINDFTSYRQLYEEVKDNETVTQKAKIDDSVSFGELTVTQVGSASYSSNGIISINGLTAHTESSSLFEENVKYSLRLGLARLDENGQYSSANTVTLQASDGSTPASEYMDTELELTLSGEFSLPTVLAEGEYVVVVYYATEDEGIRVTQMSPVAFFSADEGTLETIPKLMDVTVKKVGDTLRVTYNVSLSDTVTADFTKSEYTYEEIERVLIRGVLAKGYPISEAVVQNDKGETLNESYTYGAGTYRLKYLVNTSQGLVEAYMYTTLD